MRFGLRSKLGALLMGSITSVATEQPVAALTFDDGPDPIWTPHLLEVLEKYQAKATFFMVGVCAQEHFDLVRRVTAGGHAIGNHSWSHESFPLLTRQERLKQLCSCARVLGSYGGQMFRPPFGHQDFRSRFDLWTAGYRVITWSVVEPDWLDRDAETLASGILRRLRPGAIILLHDRLFDYLNPAYRNREPTVKAVELVLRELSGRYKFVTVPDLLRRGHPRRDWWIRPAEISVLNALQRQEAAVHAE